MDLTVFVSASKLFHRKGDSRALCTHGDCWLQGTVRPIHGLSAGRGGAARTGVRLLLPWFQVGWEAIRYNHSFFFVYRSGLTERYGLDIRGRLKLFALQGSLFWRRFAFFRELRLS
jgi:hypothetical protein